MGIFRPATDCEASPQNCRSFPRHYLEEVMEREHQADSDEAGDDAALDLFDPFLFRRDADPELPHGMRMGYVSPPGFAPIGLSFGRVGCHRVAHAAQIRAALPAEFEVIVDLKTACGTEHSNSSENISQPVSWREARRQARADARWGLRSRCNSPAARGRGTVDRLFWRQMRLDSQSVARLALALRTSMLAPVLL